MLLPLATLLITLAVISIVSARQRRQRQLDGMRAQWGHPIDRERPMPDIADLFRSSDKGDSLDDRTWDDLLLDDVFAWVDRTESRIGQQVLYKRLRGAMPPALEAFEALIGRFTREPAFRERTQLALARLRNPSVYYVHQLARPEAIEYNPSHVLFPIWSAAIVSTLLLAFVWRGLLLVGIVAFVVNLVIRGMTGRRVSRDIVAFAQIGPLMSVAKSMTAVENTDTAAITGTLADDIRALRRLQAIARWVTRDASSPGGELQAALLEYLNILLLMDLNALYLASHELKARRAHLLRLVTTVGDIDAAIAVASWRSGEPQWITPTFVAPDARATFGDLVHPLVDQAVPNSLTAAPPHGVLVTGSNMSGKSTFLRTVGVNAVLAQTLHTALARS
jgi:hypothetical protein